MVALVSTVAYTGLEARRVEVQCQLANGLPGFHLVGLASKAVNESRQRVQAALTAMGLALPPKRITLNLSPADLPKEGAHFDLPIALALLAAMGVTDAEQLHDFIIVGQLALDGRIIASPGVMLAAMAAHTHDKGLICPAAQGSEAHWACPEAPILAAPDLASLLGHLKGTATLPPPAPGKVTRPAPLVDLAQVRGQETAKRALEIAAAGGHNLLMVGPPGTGKSLLARCLPGILPPLTPAEALDVSMIRSVAGLLHDGEIDMNRPFRHPHHSASMAALTGGGQRPRPGEASLAHHGVLFLDELPEFMPPALDALREPLETGEVCVARAQGHVSFPARFQLLAAMNPCRCGQADDPALACARAPRCAADYQSRLSGPLLDRLDLAIEVPRMAPADLAQPATAEPSASVARRVAAAHALQQARQPGTPNARLEGAALDAHATPNEAGQQLLLAAAEKLKLSGRGFTRLRRVSRSIADLAGDATISRAHVAEALSYRRRLHR